MLAFGRSLYSIGLNLLFPRQCVGCGTEGAYICSACEGRLAKLPALTCLACGRRRPDGRTCASCRKKLSITGLVAGLRYGDPLARELIHELKYHRVREIAAILAGYLTGTIEQLTPWLIAESLIVPVPLHKSRERERGFNQATLIAEALAGTLKIPFLPALVRTRKTKSQIELKDPDLRRENVSSAFALAPKNVILPKRVLLVDDVATTGATLAECARVLRQAGVREVWGAVVAR